MPDSTKRIVFVSLCLSIIALGVSGGLFYRSIDRAVKDDPAAHDGCELCPGAASVKLDLVPSDPKERDFSLKIDFTVGEIPIEKFIVDWQTIDDAGRITHFTKNIDFFDALTPGTYTIEKAIVIPGFYDRSLHRDSYEIRIQVSVQDYNMEWTRKTVSLGHQTPERMRIMDEREGTYLEEHVYFRELAEKRSQNPATANRCAAGKTDLD